MSDHPSHPLPADPGPAGTDPAPPEPVAADPAVLFAYGTLLPGEPRWGFLAPFALDAGTPAAVAGWLFDTGHGYPAARFAWEASDTTAPVIHGTAFAIDPTRLAEAWHVLDEVEGAVAGLYRRVTVRLVDGAVACAYEYGGGLELRPIASGRWIDAAG